MRLEPAVWEGDLAMGVHRPHEVRLDVIMSVVADFGGRRWGIAENRWSRGGRGGWLKKNGG